MDFGHARVAGLIGDIYQAVYDPSTWPAVVETMRGLFHGSNACLVRIGPNLGPNDSIRANADPAFLTSFVEDFAHEPNVLRDAVTMTPVGLVYRDHALVGPDRLRATRFWNEWMQPQDMYGGMACKVLASGPSLWMVDIQRGRNQPAFSDSDTERFGLLAHHLRRALEIERHLRTSQAMAGAFSSLPIGIALVDPSRRVVTMNEAAERVLTRKGSPLVCRAGHLVTTDAENAWVLRRMVVEACALGAGAQPALGGSLLLKSLLPDGSLSVVSATVGPVIRGAYPLNILEPCAAVFIREQAPDLPSGFDAHLRQLFRFTPKEAEIAAALAAGLTLKDAAQAAGMKLSTARWHVEHIFAKTETRRQSQLVARLKSLQPMLGGPQAD